MLASPTSVPRVGPTRPSMHAGTLGRHLSKSAARPRARWEREALSSSHWVGRDEQIKRQGQNARIH